MSQLSNSPVPPGVGAAIGGAVGSVIPGLGTVAGAAAGTVVQELVTLFSNELSKRQREKRWQEWQKRQEEKKRQADERERLRIEEQERAAQAFYAWFSSLTQDEQDAFLREQKRRPGAERVSGPEPLDAKFVPSTPVPYSPSSPPSHSFNYSPSIPSQQAFAFTLTEREGQLLVIGIIASIILMISNK